VRPERRVRAEKVGSDTMLAQIIKLVQQAQASKAQDELLTLAAAAETDSEHPLGAAIVAGARDRGLTLPAVAGFDSITGKGVQATVAGHTALVGAARLLAGAGIDPTVLGSDAAELSADGKTLVLAAIDGEPAGVLAIADPVKDDSAAAIAALHHLGVEVVMLTGDKRRHLRCHRPPSGSARGAGRGTARAQASPSPPGSSTQRSASGCPRSSPQRPWQPRRCRWSATPTGSAATILYSPTITGCAGSATSMIRTHSHGQPKLGSVNVPYTSSVVRA